MVESMREQLKQWPHVAGAEHAAERELLVIMAEGIDAARESVSAGSAALPLVNACRYVMDALRKLAPRVSEDAEDDAMAWED